MKKIAIASALISTITLMGCTATKVTPLAANIKKDICIQQNDKVIVKNFLEIITNGFEDHGFNARVFQGNTPDSCSTILTYTATRKWDLAPYMTDAELWLRDRNGNRVGYAQYHLNGGGGLALNKWASAESKMKPVIEELLSSFPK